MLANRYCFLKQYRLLRSAEFRIGWKFGRSVAGSFLFLKVYRSHNQEPRMGLVVSRGFGKAVIRNKFKRLVREAFRLSRWELPSFCSFVIYPRKGSQKASLLAIQEELRSLLDSWSSSGKKKCS